MIGIDAPEVVEAELLEELRHAFLSRPRNHQVELGASEAGSECVRELICRLGGMTEPADARQGVNFKAEVGTMIHAGFASIFDASVLNKGHDGVRYLTETILHIGDYASRKLIGSCDLFDRLSGGVIDHKTKSKTMLLHAKRHGMTLRQRVQVQLYGLGWHRLGMHVNWVGCLFVPRDGELRECFLRAEPFDARVGEDCLARLDTLGRVVDALGIDAALAAYGDPICGDQWCRWCPSPRKYRPNGTGHSDDPFGGIE